MAKKHTTKKKAAKGKSARKVVARKAPPRVENPDWLAKDPAEGPNPPVTTRPSELAFLELTWENFERLCYRLAKLSGEVEKAWVYGTPGYEQHGIDILVRKNDGSYEAWQSKRYKKFGPTDVKAAVKAFSQAAWAKDARRFVLAVGCKPEDPKTIVEIEKARDGLKAKGIEFDPLFATELTEVLKPEPDIIDDFFGRAWVQAICPPEIAAKLQERLSRVDIGSMRGRLRVFYMAWIAAVDPGLPLVGTAASDVPAPTLVQRYVVPDILLGLQASEPPQAAEPDPGHAIPDERAIKTGDKSRSELPGRARVSAPPPVERRTSAVQFLSETSRAIITAEAGAGKTTFLRHIALEVLAETPVSGSVAEKYVGLIPVWVPFALWARMSEGKDRPPPLEDVVHGFIEALSDRALADDMRRALRTKKFLLLVDGLDETRDQSVADALVVSLTVFAEQTGVAVLATSRPHGIKALSGTGGTWTRAALAPLSEPQRAQLALMWYRILEGYELGAGADAKAVERQANVRAQNFIRALLGSPGIARLAQTPLFLLSLLKLHRLDRDLPRNRFDASKEIADQLVLHQPKRRAKDAMRVEARAQNMRQRDRLLEDFAYGLHTGELAGSVPDGALEREAVARAAGVIMARTGSANRDEAEDQAREIFAFSEEVAGLLVKKAQDHVGFLHRSLQEYYVGSCLAQLPLAERVGFINNHAAQPAWKEPILYLLYLVRSEQEAGQLLEAIEAAQAADVAEQAARSTLLTEATFADFAHEIPKVRRVAANIFSEAELESWGSRQREILSAAVDGLFSQAVAVQCEAKLAEWSPDYHGYSRAPAVAAMMDWDEASRRETIPVLLRIVAGEVDYVWRPAGMVLAKFGSDAELKSKLLALARRPRSIDTLHAAFFALGRGWGKDADVAELADHLRASNISAIQIEAMRIRVERGEADLSDLELFAAIAFQPDQFMKGVIAPDIVSYLAKAHRAELIVHVEQALRRTSRRRFDLSLVGALVLADPAHPMVEDLVAQLLGEDWAAGELFARSNFPAALVNWTPRLIALVEAFLAKERHLEYEAYWTSKVLPLPSIKSRMLKSIKNPQGLTFWSASGLAEVWGRKDPQVVAAFEDMLKAPTDALANVAEELPSVLDDRDAVRAAILRGLRDKPRQTNFLVAGLGRLGVGPDDEEAFKASLEADDLSDRSLYADKWRGELIGTFAARADVRQIARRELSIRDGNIGVVAARYGADAEMRAALLKVLAPLPEADRLALVAELGTAAPSNPAALNLLAQAREDTDGATCGEVICVWTEARVARDQFGRDDRAYLANQLEALGSEYEHRRAAGLVGLTLTDNLSTFAEAKDHQGKPATVSIGGRMSLVRSDRYLSRVLPFWDRLSTALGGDQAILDRLEITPESTFAILNPGHGKADYLLGLLEARVTPSAHVPPYEHLGVVRRFAPESPLMRELVKPLLLTRGPDDYSRSRADRWAELMAADIFAEHFSQSELRQPVMDHFRQNPQNAGAAGALAETVLRRGDPEMATLLAERSKGVPYAIPTGFRIFAAVADPELIVDRLEWLLNTRPGEPEDWYCPYWVPGLLLRIERDERLTDLLIATQATTASASARLSELALIGRGAKDKAKSRAILTAAIKDFEAAAPVIGFDVTSAAIRLAVPAIQELLT